MSSAFSEARMSIDRIEDAEELEELLHVVAKKLRDEHQAGRWWGRMSYDHKLLAVQFTNINHPTMRERSHAT